MGAAAEMLLELHDADPAKCTLIGERDEAASRARLDRHLRYHRDTRTGGDHSQNCRELAAFENHVGIEAGASAGRKRVVAKAVTFLQQEEGISFYLLEMDGRLLGQSMVAGHDGIEAFAQDFLREKIAAGDG